MSTSGIHAVVAACQREVLSFAVALTRSEHDAYDVYQESVLRAIEHADAIRDVSQLPAWLKTTIRHLVFERHRRSGRATEALPTELPEEFRHPLNQVPSVDELIEPHAADIHRWRRSLERVLPALSPALASFASAVLDHGSREGVCQALGLDPHEFRRELSRLRKALMNLGVIATTEMPTDSGAWYPIPYPGHPLERLFHDLTKAWLLTGWGHTDGTLDVSARVAERLTDGAERERVETLLYANAVLYLVAARLFALRYPPAPR